MTFHAEICLVHDDTLRRAQWANSRAHVEPAAHTASASLRRPDDRLARDRYLNESHLAIEQRANAFAVRFLCPESMIKKLNPSSIEDPKVIRLLAGYGLPYQALRLYLRNEASVELPEMSSSAVVAFSTEARWVAAEDPTGLSGFPLSEVAPERRTDVARTAARLYSEGLIGRDRFADVLGVTPAADLESVLDFFALDLPKNAASVPAA